MKYLILLFFSFYTCLFFQKAAAQEKNSYPGFNDEVSKKIGEDSTSKLYVSIIVITGNRRTKTYIILRELEFKTGDSIIAGRLREIVEQSRALVYNTNLFSDVTITPVLDTGSNVAIKINVLEKFYVFPIPQFKLVDRNLNEWLKTYNADLDRVIYGAKFEHYNISGRGDRLRIFLLNGYARAASFNYFAPYSNGALTEGFSVGSGYSSTKELAYKTSADNKLVQFKIPGFARNEFFINASYQRRRGFFKKNSYAFSYNYIDVSDSVVLSPYNPHYFNLNRSYVGYTDFQYSYQYSNTNNINYPLQGKILNASALKRGFGWKGSINMLMLNGNYSLFYTHSNNWYSSIETYAKIKLPFKQAYINQSALGYADFYLRGLEYYVIDGVAAGLAKYTLRKKLFAFDIPVPFHIKKLPKLPFAFYAKTYADLGYSYTQREFDTKLANRLLYTGGFGLDILSIYDSTLKLEYSFNQLGENGLFLRIRSGF